MGNLLRIKNPTGLTVNSFIVVPYIGSVALAWTTLQERDIADDQLSSDLMAKIDAGTLTILSVIERKPEATVQIPVSLAAALTGLTASDPPATLGDIAKFISAEITGTGSSQSTAHGLDHTPTSVLVCLTSVPVGGAVVTEGVHTSTNVLLTVTTGAKYKILAF